MALQSQLLASVQHQEMLLIRGIRSSSPASPSPLHINLNYNPKVQTLCSSRREQSPVSPGTGHSLYPAEGEHTSPLLQPWPRAHPSHEHKASALGALVPDAGAPLPSPQQLQPPLALSLLQEVGTSWEQRSRGALKMSVSVPSTLLLLLAFMASSPSAVSLSRKVRVWCPIHLDTQGTQNGDRPRTGPQGMTAGLMLQRYSCTKTRLQTANLPRAHSVAMVRHFPSWASPWAHRGRIHLPELYSPGSFDILCSFCTDLYRDIYRHLQTKRENGTSS